MRLTLEVDFEPGNINGEEVSTEDFADELAKNLAYCVAYRLLYGFSLDAPTQYFAKVPEGTHPDDKISVLMQSICVSAEDDTGWDSVHYMGRFDKDLDIKHPELIGKEEKRDEVFGDNSDGDKEEGR